MCFYHLAELHDSTSIITEAPCETADRIFWISKMKKMQHQPERPHADWTLSKSYNTLVSRHQQCPHQANQWDTTDRLGPVTIIWLPQQHTAAEQSMNIHPQHQFNKIRQTDERRQQNPNIWTNYDSKKILKCIVILPEFLLEMYLTSSSQTAELRRRKNRDKVFILLFSTFKTTKQMLECGGIYCFVLFFF